MEQPSHRPDPIQPEPRPRRAGTHPDGDRLRQRVIQLFDRIETQLKQVLREAELKEGRRTRLSAAQSANLMLSAAEGRICQYVRSGFSRVPTAGWEDQWNLLGPSLFNVS